MSNENWPGGFVSAKKLRDAEEKDEDVTVFNDHGVRYVSGGERSQEYLYMEDMPAKMENRC